MIPRAYITEWQARVPWPQSFQIEQDLILARLMIEIANDGLLGNELVMRGGGRGLFTGCAAGDSAMAAVLEVRDAG